ncbi:MAG: MBOAT family O-acyltransferase [Rhodospirillales bacterium]|nr:MBOAT family O-acyltransferase [Rhodospirillales bacterium]
MLFHSFQFAVFFAVVYPLYLGLPHRWQNRMLLVASYVFYGYWDWRYLSLILISTVADYGCAIGIERTDNVKHRKGFVAVSVIVNMTLLGIFKYYDFFATSFQDFMGVFGLAVHPYFLDVALPIGISFYTFQTMSYTIDVYRSKLKAARNFFDFALYVSFFPQLIAGPIERGTRLLPQILAPREVTLEKVYKGAYFFVWGIFLKVFVADNLARIVDPVFNAPPPYDGASVLFAVYAFSFQIYCDFAGYSFMAIGLAMAMGITLMENFRRPYFAKNIAEFWRRWHISLSSWFRDYVFSPFYMYMEKNPRLRRLPMKTRHGVAFFAILLATEFLLGLWHGAAWTFAFFGVYHALMIWAYYQVRKMWDRMNPFVQIILMYHVACGGWLIFRAESMAQAGEMARALVLNFHLAPALDLSQTMIKMVVFISLLFVVQVFQDWKKDTTIVLKAPAFIQYGFFVLITSLVLVFGEFDERPFIYFQF